MGAGGQRQSTIRVIIFDWGDTVMKVFPEFSGPMAHWPKVEAVLGVEEALKMAAKDYQLVLASNAADSSSDLVRDALERVGLERYFLHVMTARDLGAAKPEPGFFKAVLRNTGCQPGEAVMVGDHFETDIASAKGVGLWTIWYNPRGKDPPKHRLPAADVVIQRYDDFDNALMIIRSRSERTSM